MNFLRNLLPKTKPTPKPIDWQKSRAHVLLLSTFLTPSSKDSYEGQYPGWPAALGESPEDAIKRLIHDGMLEQCDLGDCLDYGFTVTDLRQMLRDRRLKVSGRKGELIARLIAADTDGMKRATSGLAVRWRCSEKGREIASQYVEEQRVKREETEAAVLEALSQRDFHLACRLVGSYEAQQVFPRGLSTDWSNYPSKHDLAALESIFGDNPQISAMVSDLQLDQLRLAAAMMYLWGINRAPKSLLPEPVSGEFDNDDLARFLCGNAYSRFNAIVAEDLALAGLEIVKSWLAVGDDSVCDVCRANQKQGWIPLDQAFSSGHMQPLAHPACRCCLLTQRKGAGA